MPAKDAETPCFRRAGDAILSFSRRPFRPARTASAPHMGSVKNQRTRLCHSHVTDAPVTSGPCSVRARLRLRPVSFPARSPRRVRRGVPGVRTIPRGARSMA